MANSKNSSQSQTLSAEDIRKDPLFTTPQVCGPHEYCSEQSRYEYDGRNDTYCLMDPLDVSLKSFGSGVGPDFVQKLSTTGLGELVNHSVESHHQH